MPLNSKEKFNLVAGSGTAILWGLAIFIPEIRGALCTAGSFPLIALIAANYNDLMKQ